VYEANRYAYADCNPANKTDPTGLLTENCLGAINDVLDFAIGIALNWLPGSGLLEEATSDLIDYFLGKFFNAAGVAIDAGAGNGLDPVGSLIATVDELAAPFGFLPGISGWVGSIIDFIGASWSVYQCGQDLGFW
jgi:hypothetical protein